MQALEDRFGPQLQIISVHSAKFTNEKNTEDIRAAMRRYGIKHPVVNDRDFRIWQNYAVQAWPTFVLIDPFGYVILVASGEGQGDLLGALITDTLAHFGDDLPKPAEIPAFDLGNTALALAFPGKVVFDPQTRLIAVAESAAHRIILMREDGKVVKVAGNGKAGHNDGNLVEARFNEPQGMAFYRGTLLVADRGNHLIRRVDPEEDWVSTVAGDGRKEFNPRGKGKARETALNSPWDLQVVKDEVYIAMAGNHQIWRFQPQSGLIGPFAGTGEENIRDESLGRAFFAQPTGLTWDGSDSLYVADSETSAVRRIKVNRGRVDTLVGTGLFDFGDRLGSFAETRLQHPQDVVYKDGSVFVADSYNHRIVSLDLRKREAHLVVDGLSEPAGLTTDGLRLLVADTNAGRIIAIEDQKVHEFVIRMETAWLEIIGKDYTSA